jgi:hypothetical protein
MMIETKVLRWAGHVARMGQMRYIYTMLVGRPERHTRLGRTTHG